MIGRKSQPYHDEAHILRAADANPLPRYRPGLARLRNLLIVAVLLVVSVEFLGVPHLRFTYEYRGPASAPTILRARYWSVTGTKDATAGQYGNGCPLIAFIPAERSIRANLAEWWGGFMGRMESISLPFPYSKEES